MKKIVIATGNPGKKKEILECLLGLKDTLELLSLNDFEEVPEPDETGTTFEENAALKAEYYGKVLNMPVIAEDSGFVLEALPEMFGLNTKRQFQAKDDMDWMTQFLDLVVPLENRKATFYSSLSFYDPATGICQTVLGSTTGEMVDFPQAPLEKGIPVSAVFRPEGQDEVFSALPGAIKNKISHRGQAMQKFVPILENFVG